MAKFAVGHQFENQDTRFAILATTDSAKGPAYLCEYSLFRQPNPATSGVMPQGRGAPAVSGPHWEVINRTTTVYESEFEQLLAAPAPAHMDYV